MAAGQINSIRELARQLGISHVAVLKWLKRGDWTFGRGPWPVQRLAAIRRWAAGNLLLSGKAGGKQQPDMVEGEAAKQGVTFEHAKKLVALSNVKHKTVVTDILLKKYHLVDQCRERRARIIHATKQELLAIPDSLPVEPEVKDLVRRRIEEILQKFAAGYLPVTEGT